MASFLNGLKARHRASSWIAVLLAMCSTVSVAAQEPIVIREGLVLDRVGSGGRAPFHVDAIALQQALGEFDPPEVGDEVAAPNGPPRSWRTLRANDDGWFRDRALRGGYLAARFHSDSDATMLLEARGHGMAFVNGAPRAGDVYNLGWSILPIEVKTGENHLLFQAQRGEVRVRLLPAPASNVQLDRRDMTLPTLVAGETENVWGALLLIHAGERLRDDLSIVVQSPGIEPLATNLPPIAARTTRKIGFQIPPSVPEAGGARVAYDVLLIAGRDGDGEVIARERIELSVVEATASHTRTFISEIDGSVQYYAVRPPARVITMDEPRPGLLLTLHGAGVEGAGMRDQYAPKDWAFVVAPTNRRPFGFDWEDWGRLDALEVEALARDRYATDPTRSWLTGHSMGGHGTWQIAVHAPDRFAAIGPSAGWISFWSYTGAARYDQPSPIEALIHRSMSPSDTLALADNYLTQGIYILHGDADDNVRVDQARTMVGHLAAMPHPNFVYREIAGAGHWWGSQCCDWPPMMEYFQHHALPRPGEVRRIRFRTAAPSVSASSHWVTIREQQQPFITSGVDLRHDPGAKAIAGTTENIEWLSIDADLLGAPIERVELDGQAIELPEMIAEEIHLAREQDGWRLAEAPSALRKGPQRGGPFKAAFNHRVLFVYGTQGTPEETEWAFAKARFDAETFGYRGNGSIDVIPDTMFESDHTRDRSVVLYGHADSNRAWAELLGDSPVQARRGHVTVGDRRFEGDNLGILLVRPRPGSEVAHVAAVTGSGLVGLRLTDRLPYFVSGVAYPDWIIFDETTLTHGTAGVVGAGFFGNDWSLAAGEAAFRD